MSGPAPGPVNSRYNDSWEKKKPSPKKKNNGEAGNGEADNDGMKIYYILKVTRIKRWLFEVYDAFNLRGPASSYPNQTPPHPKISPFPKT